MSMHDDDTRARTTPYRVLFVCTANISRSAYAEVTARARTTSDLEFRSAGIHALSGQPMDPLMAALTGDEQDAGGHRAQQISRDLVAGADLVLALASEHRRFMLDEWPGQGRKIYVIGHAAREMALLPAPVALDRLIDYLWQHRTAMPADGVPDPYGKGRAASRDAARLIDGFLDSIITCLERLTQHRARPSPHS